MKNSSSIFIFKFVFLLDGITGMGNAEKKGPLQFLIKNNNNLTFSISMQFFRGLTNILYM
jgi:hypothetical protein